MSTLLRPKKWTLMILVGARTTFSTCTKTKFVLFLLYIKNPLSVSLVVEFLKTHSTYFGVNGREEVGLI